MALQSASALASQVSIPLIQRFLFFFISAVCELLGHNRPISYILNSTLKRKKTITLNHWMYGLPVLVWVPERTICDFVFLKMVSEERRVGHLCPRSPLCHL
jgi:hypothetical protein